MEKGRKGKENKREEEKKERKESVGKRRGRKERDVDWKDIK